MPEESFDDYPPVLEDLATYGPFGWRFKNTGDGTDPEDLFYLAPPEAGGLLASIRDVLEVPLPVEVI